MKLKVYLLTVLTACFLFSCSNSDTPDNPTPPVVVEKDAFLSMSINKIGLSTKAFTEDADGGIHSLAVAVFDNGAYKSNANFANNGHPLKEFKVVAINEIADLLEVTDIPVAGGKIKVLVFANLSQADFVNAGLISIVGGKVDVGTATLKHFLDFQTDLEREQPNQLTMSSEVLTMQTIAQVKNCLGYTDKVTEIKGGVSINTSAGVSENGVKLFRLASRVQLKGLKIGAEARVGDLKMGTAKAFHLDSVFIMNAKQFSRLASSQAWGMVESSTNKWYNGAYEEKLGAYKEHVAADGKRMDMLCQSYRIPFEIGTPNYITSPFEHFFYVYENGLKQQGWTPVVTQDYRDFTLLVIQGDYTYLPLGKEDVEENYITYNNRFYAVPVNKGTNKYHEVAVHEYVKRNVKYAINATINGPGSDNPVDPQSWLTINAVVEVMDWNVIIIDDEVR